MAEAHPIELSKGWSKLRAWRGRIHPPRSALLYWRGDREALGVAVPARGPREASQKGGGTPFSVSRENWRRFLSAAPTGTPEKSPPSTTQEARQAAAPRVEHQARTVSGWICREEKRLRALEQLRPDVVAKRKAFWRMIRRVSSSRLVFLDESGLNVSMTRSHAWVKPSAICSAGGRRKCPGTARPPSGY